MDSKTLINFPRIKIGISKNSSSKIGLPSVWSKSDTLGVSNPQLISFIPCQKFFSSSPCDLIIYLKFKSKKNNRSSSKETFFLSTMIFIDLVSKPQCPFVCVCLCLCHFFLRLVTPIYKGCNRPKAKLYRVAPLITDPPPTIFISF